MDPQPEDSPTTAKGIDKSAKLRYTTLTKNNEVILDVFIFIDSTAVE